MENPLVTLFKDQFETFGETKFDTLDHYKESLESIGESLVEEIWDFVRTHKTHPEDLDIEVEELNEN